MSSEYNIEKMKERIKKQRISLGLKQEELALKINVSRTTIISWESKEGVIPKIEFLLSLCEVLQCDTDYLLGKIDMPRNATTDIHKYTGLSEMAINNLVKIKDYKIFKVLDKFLSNVSLLSILGHIYIYRQAKSDYEKISDKHGDYLRILDNHYDKEGLKLHYHINSNQYKELCKNIAVDEFRKMLVADDVSISDEYSKQCFYALAIQNIEFTSHSDKEKLK